MSSLARGAAWLDSGGARLAADPGFLRALGLPAEEAAAALAARGAAAPALAAFLAGHGPAAVDVAGAGAQPLRLERVDGEGGRLLVLRAPADELRLERAAAADAVVLLVRGLFHDANGPLSTMKLRLELLSERLGGEAAGEAVNRQLQVVQAQIGRIGELLRRLRELVAPSAPVVEPDLAVLGGLDLAALVGDAAALLSVALHERELRLALSVPPGPVRTGAEPSRAGRLVLALLGEAVGTAAPGAVVELSVAAEPGAAALGLRYEVVAGQSGLGDDPEVAAGAAQALGGTLARSIEAGRARVDLRLPRGAGA